MSAEGTTSPPSNSSASGSVPLSPFPALAPGIRYPMYAVQGTSLLYSPIFGQTAMFPWRSPSTSISVAPNVSLLQPTSSTPPAQTQQTSSGVPGLVYPLATFGLPILTTPRTKSDGKRTALQSESSRQRDGLGHAEGQSKKPRVSDGSPHHSPNTPSPQLTSPVIKLIHYNPAGQVQAPSTSLSANSTPQDSAFSQVPRPLSFPDNFHMVLLKGIGSIPEAIAQQGNVLVSSFISGLYQYVLTSANPPLSSESCALLTICYLSSLQQGELISPDQLHATLHYTQLGETEWLQYYRKHKKMSESTFVQSQLVHLSKIAVYPVVGRVQVMVSSQSLGEGILYTLSSVAHIAKTTKASLPDFIVMLTVQSSASMEFCVLVLQPIQARLITDQLGRGRGSSHAPPPCPDLLMDKELLLCMRGHQRRLGGKVLPPFLRPGELLTPLNPEEASSLAPPTSHIIEHRPEGPYQQQYSLALFLLQKTLAALSPHTRMEDFDKVDFAVLCPSEDAFVVQMTADILDSQLLLHLEGGGEGAGLEPDQLLKAAEKRVIDCGRGQEKLEAFVSTMESHPKTLYVVVVENAHLLTAVAMDPTHFCETGCHIENKRLLSTHNAILLCVTSQPSRLLTNRSLLPITNELYWPSKDSAPMGEQQFWSSSFGKPSGLIFREDPIFEKLFHDVCSTQSPLVSLMTVRAQLLVNQYAAALTNAVSPGSGHPALPETQAIVSSLVMAPMSSTQGHGPMVILRCHDTLLALECYQKLKAVRDCLGLEYRFEMIYDDGQRMLNVSEHFRKRLSLRKCRNDGRLCYKDLDNLPCFVVLAGTSRASVGFPSSLMCVDLRLCYFSSTTRLDYEYDMSLLNGYRTIPPSIPVYTFPVKGPVHQVVGAVVRALIQWEEEEEVEEEEDEDRNVVRWRPNGPDGIDEPEVDNRDCTKSVGEYIGVGHDHFGPHNGHAPGSLPDVNPVDLFASLGDTSDDSEVEDSDCSVAPPLCLLSRPYYHIWSSRGAGKELLLPPGSGVEWHGHSKRPPLFDADPLAQSTYYRKWTRPAHRLVRSHLDSMIRDAKKGAKRRFLLAGQPQIGKTGAWLLFVRLLMDHLHSLQGVTVMCDPLAASIFLGEGPTSSDHASSMHSRVIPLEQLQTICTGTAVEGNPPKVATTPNSHTVSLPLSPYTAHDATHSCTECAKRGMASSHAHTLTSLLPLEGEGSVIVQWHIPECALKHFVLSSDCRSVERVKLSTALKSKEATLTPIITNSYGPDATALLNLAHTGFDGLHIVATHTSQFDNYRKSWPHLIIMGLPDMGCLGTGSNYHLTKVFAQHNYLLNVVAQQQEAGQRTVWPFVLVKNDQCVMWKKIDASAKRSTDLSLPEALRSIEQDAECSENAAISILQWSKELESSPPCLTHYDLNHDFILLNLSMLGSTHYNPFLFHCTEADFNLQLKAAGLKAHLYTELAFVKKHQPSCHPRYPFYTQLGSLCSDADKLAISLHHDASSLLPHPGPYLMEHFLYHRSVALFPPALSTTHPVLVLDNYVNLSSSIHVVFTKPSCNMLEQLHHFDGIRFGGLVLYLCEGKVSAEQLHKFSFVSGAGLCLVTRDCKSLVREVARLDLEDHWKFRLRDEYQTACPDQYKPLFFLTGRYN
eukprot:Em0023g36a